ncbi:ArdC-like ssDNA-binding domain-containing protein [Rhodococcus opacus]|uniref:ArdC-like ssDNA-binding domain-containing protein n=1 Tax=Rhodococcus opacus TaxID=37919 RepID=UPI00046D06B5|nr:ArdC-like ssDNA-binding domain-containing protein [Rhodococcus opacus]UDH01628.1 ImmA/IrrE family metallo-endopeptidase [Rhodococcus opacus PD630]
MGMQNKSSTERAEARRQLATQLHETITAKVDALTGTEQWAAYLAAASAFHSYSFNNVLLIMAQLPHASQVAGFRKWQEQGRQVRKGEIAIRIFGYSTRTVTETDPDTGEESKRKVPTYPVLSVFDISQTDPIEGHPQPEPIAHRLEGEDTAAILDRVRDIMTGQGWTVTREPIPGPTNGFTTLDGSRRIVVDAALSPAQAAKTMIHEAAHALMHVADDVNPAELHRGRAEVEAESVAYVLAGLLGLDTSEYSIGYIAKWADGDTAAVAETAHTVLATVHTLAAALETQNESNTGETSAA